MTRLFSGLLCLVLLVGTACSDRVRRNPLDSRAQADADDRVEKLTAVAADGRVRLFWDFTYFHDILGYKVYRRESETAFTCLTDLPLGPGATSYVDRDVLNGQGYEYRLGLLVAGEGERLLEDTAAATPGTEVVWVADRASGRVWLVAPDGRAGVFARGRFASVEGMDVDPADGSCWVSDRYFPGLYRLMPSGELRAWRAELVHPGPLRVDGRTGRVWVVDQASHAVHWFDLPVRGEALVLGVVDARFTAPTTLAPRGGGCWIADPEGNRVLYYHPSGNRAEFRALSGLQALAAGPQGSAWALVDGGARLVRLGPMGEESFVDVGFFAESLVVDQVSGGLWVVGSDQVVRLSASGRRVQGWDAPPAARSLALDSVHGTLWVAGEEELWKFTVEGEILAQLRGFAGVSRVAVTPEIGVTRRLDRAW